MQAATALCFILKHLNQLDVTTDRSKGQSQFLMPVTYFQLHWLPCSFVLISIGWKKIWTLQTVLLYLLKKCVCFKMNPPPGRGAAVIQQQKKACTAIQDKKLLIPVYANWLAPTAVWRWEVAKTLLSLALYTSSLLSSPGEFPGLQLQFYNKKERQFGVRARELKGEQQLAVFLNDITVITKGGMVKSRGELKMMEAGDGTAHTELWFFTFPL